VLPCCCDLRLDAPAAHLQQHRTRWVVRLLQQRLQLQQVCWGLRRQLWPQRQLPVLLLLLRARQRLPLRLRLCSATLTAAG
jgi:hypothetical protein